MTEMTTSRAAEVAGYLKQWMFDPNHAPHPLLAKPSFTGPTDRNTNLKNSRERKFLQWEKQTFGINLGWTDDASPATAVRIRGGSSPCPPTTHHLSAMASRSRGRWAGLPGRGPGPALPAVVTVRPLLRALSTRRQPDGNHVGFSSSCAADRRPPEAKDHSHEDATKPGHRDSRRRAGTDRLRDRSRHLRRDAGCGVGGACPGRHLGH
jgi:hypothetical protein